MKDKILAFLKTKLNGVPDNYLLGVAETFSKTIKDEKDIETVFTDGIIETLKFSASQLQIEGDRRATEAQKTALKNFQEKHGLNDDGTPKRKPGRPPKDKDDDSEDSEDGEKIPTWAKKILAKNAELEQKIEAQVQEKTLASLAEKVSKHDKLKDIPETFLIGRNLVPKSEAEIDQLATEIRTIYDKHVQSETEKGAYISIPAAGAGHSGDKVTIDDYLNDKFPDRSKS